MHIRLIAATALLTTLTSCSSESEPKVYRLAKEQTKPKAVTAATPNAAQMKQMAGELPPPPDPTQPIKWNTPSSWTEHPASGMRIGSFTIGDDENREVDISIIFLGGRAGGDLPNVNRWRGQIALSPWSEADFSNNIAQLNSQLGMAKVVDFGTDPAVDGPHATRIVAAIIPYQEGTWFFKMMGNAYLIEKNKATFMHFIKEVRLNNG
jgi:hypothetical protein